MAKSLVRMAAMALAFIPVSAHAVSQILVLGEGRTTCADYLTDRQHGKWTDTIEWVEGYLAGYEAGANYSFPANVEGKTVIAWFDSYCPSHRSVSILEAADTFAASLVKPRR